MTRCWIGTALLATMLLGSPSPGQAQNRERQQIMAEVRMLHEQTMRLQLLITSLSDTIAELSRQLDDNASETTRVLADQRLLVDNVADDVRILREKLDDTNVRISSMSQELEALRVAIPPMSYGPGATDPETGLPLDPALDGDAARPAVPIVNPGVSPQRMYDTAWSDYTNGQWDLAIEGFEAYLRTFPRSELADDAQFYIGQTHYADGQFEAAVSAFELVLQRYPQGDAVPEASYKRGLALDRLGDVDRAQEAFEYVVENHPNHTMATLARQALERLGQP